MDLTRLLTLEVPLCYYQSSVCRYSFLENLNEGDHMRHVVYFIQVYVS